MEKPRIRLNPNYHDLIKNGLFLGFHRCRYECQGAGVSGFGGNPGDAFDQWLESAEYAAKQPERDRLRAIEEAKITARRRERLYAVERTAEKVQFRKRLTQWMGA